MVEIAECFEPPISQKIHKYQKRKKPKNVPKTIIDDNILILELLRMRR